MEKKRPGFSDFLAAGALANIPIWVYVILLSFDINKHLLSSEVFHTLAPSIAILGGGLLASLVLCNRNGKATFRIGLLVGVAATIVNFAFGVLTSEPSATPIAAFFFLTGSILAVLVKTQRKNQKTVAAY